MRFQSLTTLILLIMALSAPVFAQDAAPAPAPPPSLIDLPAPAAELPAAPEPLVIAEAPASEIPQNLGPVYTTSESSAPLAPIQTANDNYEHTQSVMQRIVGDPEPPQPMVVYETAQEPYNPVTQMLQASVVPEPGSFVALAAGMSGLGLMWRRRRK